MKKIIFTISALSFLLPFTSYALTSGDFLFSAQQNYGCLDESPTSTITAGMYFYNMDEAGWAWSGDNQCYDHSTWAYAWQTYYEGSAYFAGYPMRVKLIEADTTDLNDNCSTLTAEQCQAAYGISPMGVQNIYDVLPAISGNNYLSVPPTISVDLFALAGGLISDFWGLIAIVLGVPLAFYLINKVIDLMPSEKKSKEAIKRADRVIAESKRLRKRL